MYIITSLAIFSVLCLTARWVWVININWFFEESRRLKFQFLFPLHCRPSLWEWAEQSEQTAATCPGDPTQHIGPRCREESAHEIWKKSTNEVWKTGFRWGRDEHPEVCPGSHEVRQEIWGCQESTNAVWKTSTHEIRKAWWFRVPQWL